MSIEIIFAQSVHQQRPSKTTAKVCGEMYFTAGVIFDQDFTPQAPRDR